MVARGIDGALAVVTDYERVGDRFSLSQRRGFQWVACPPPIVTRPSRSCSFVASTLTGDSEWRLFGQVERWLFRMTVCVDTWRVGLP